MTQLDLPGSTKKDSGPLEIEHLENLAVRLLHHAPDAGCHPGDCRILVTNFVFPDGSLFPHGIQWADDLSGIFANQEKGIQVIDRARFKNLLEKDGISARLQNSEPAARWLGKQFNATVVVVGQARIVRDTIVEISARFLNVNDINLIGPSSEVKLQIMSSEEDFSPLSALPSPPSPSPLPDTINGEKVYKAGVQSVVPPSCYFMPGPNMTEDALSASYSGIVSAEGVVGTDGAIRAVRITRGAPFGLSEAVVKSIKTWKCKPAVLDERPVAVLVMFEVNFRSTK
jgi:hypothetical protein